MMKRKGRPPLSTPSTSIGIRVRSDLKARLEAASVANNRSIAAEAEQRLERTFGGEINTDHDRKMSQFWAWFDGLCDARDIDSTEGDLLGLIRRRLEHASGTRAEVVAPQPPKLVESA